MMRLPELLTTWQAASRYGNAVRWFARTLWEAFGWRVIRVIAAAQVGVLVVGAGMSLSVGYFQQLEQDGTARLGGLVAGPARDESTLTAMVILVLVVLLAGAGILLFAQSRIVAMAVELNHRVRMDVALAYGGELPEPGDWTSGRAMRRALWVLQTRDARRVAIVARSMLRNTVNVGITVVGLAALFYLEARMTLLFLVIMALAMVSYYRANASSARATRRYEAVAPGTRRGLRDLLPSLQTLSQPAPDRAELEAALDQEAVAEETDAFAERFGAHIHAEFLGFAITGVALAGLTAYMGHAALAGSMPWTRVLAYVLVLRLTLGGVQSLLRAFAFFSRFYPSIDRLNRFLSASSAATSDEPLVSLPLRASERTLAERDEVLRPVERGEVAEVLLPVRLSRYSLGLLARVLAGPDRRARRRLLGQTAMAAPLSVPATAVSLRSLLLLEGTWRPGDLRERLGDQAEAVERAVGLDPSAVVPAEAWAALPAEAADRLMVVAAEASTRPVLALDPGLATPEILARLRGAAPERIVLVCTSVRATPVGGELGASRTLVGSSRGELLAVGSPAWVAEQWEVIAEDPSETAAAQPADDEELDDED